jgi:ubiquinone/menaquinone biosynthesis C-methylase UbiE
LAFSKFFKDAQVEKIMLLGLLFRSLVAVWNGFFGPSYGAGADAINTYHEVAVNYVQHLIVSGFKTHLTYSYLLGAFYDMTAVSLFLGSLLSCIVWLVSAVVLMKIMRLLSLSILSQSIVMLIYALLPSSIMFTSVTLKEAYQLFFVNLAVYSALKIYLDKLEKYWILLLAGFVGMSALHPVLYVFGLFVVATTLISYSFRGRKKYFFLSLVITMLLAALILFHGYKYKHVFNIFSVEPVTAESRPVAMQPPAALEPPATAILNKLANRVESYQQNGLTYRSLGRAFYKKNISFNGVFDFLLFIPVSLFQYLFEPMPWRISAIVDFEALFENILRLVLIMMALLGFKRMAAGKLVPVIFVFLSYFVLESIWSLGTINWGTAIRHHIPAMGLLLVAAFASSRNNSKAGEEEAGLKTIEGFGDEWTRFDQSSFSEHEQTAIFESYFSLFPWHNLSADSQGFDLGCGSGRWARLVAPRVGRLHCVDPSIAIDVARKNLSKFPNCEFHKVTADTMPFKSKSMDFGYSLGVLHHIPDTEKALVSCAEKLKPGAPFLVYLYYAFDNKPWWYRALWRLSDALRGRISQYPYSLRYLISQVLAVFVYLPLAKAALVLEKAGINVKNFPLSAYRKRSFYTMRTDALDRFGTRLEKRFTQKEIKRMMEKTGFENIEFSRNVPFWCALGYRKKE